MEELPRTEGRPARGEVLGTEEQSSMEQQREEQRQRESLREIAQANWK
jgi:hypothetical protein